MLRLHRVVVYKVTLGFTYGGNIGSFWATLRVVWSDEGALYSSPWKRNINYWMKCVIELL